MCLYCTGCGKCAAKAAGAQNAPNLWSREKILTEAERYGRHTLAAAKEILESTSDEDGALGECAAILNLAGRFTERQVERACAYALGVVPRPRKAFIMAVLESGAAQ